MIKVAAEVLNITVEEAEKNSKPIPEINGTYFWNPSRGGGAVIIDSKKEKLTASSALSYDEHLQAFLEGKRN